jgi:recombination protein RecA
MGQGKENARQFLLDNLDIAEEIEARLKIALGMVGEPEADTEAPDPAVLENA